MAKSARASVMKRNHAKLRATVFGPVSDARTARLAAKLQDLASQPKPLQNEKTNKEDVTEMGKTVAHSCACFICSCLMSQINQQTPKSPKQVKVVITLPHFLVSFSNVYLELMLTS